MRDIGGVLFNKEIRNVKSHIPKEPRKTPDIKSGLLENLMVENRPPPFRRHLHLDRQTRHDTRPQNNKPNTPHRPRKAQFWLDFIEENGIDDTTNTGTTGSDTHSQALLGRKVSRYRGDCCQTQSATSQSDDEVPKGGAETGHHDPEDDDNAPCSNEETRMAEVEYGAIKDG